MNAVFTTVLTLCVLTPCLYAKTSAHDVGKPNIILILTDDLGWTDLGCYGSTEFQTPNLDKMAKEGIRLTQFYAAHPVCSPSRAGLLTGCYPTRIGLGGSAFWIDSKKGFADTELTMPEMLRTAGYQTGMVGKWHIGHQEEFMPNAQGFNCFEGIPYSNSMWSLRDDGSKAKFPPLPYYTDTQITDHIDSWDKMNNLTTRITEKAVGFIDNHKHEPFFLYIAHPMPHVPLGVSEKFKGRSGAGRYGDVIMELDWSVGEILKSVQKHGIDKNTLIVFTSDNGPWLNYGNHSGTCRGLREGKGTSFEGGYRIPCIVRWPDHIPAGQVSNTLTAAIDLYPTFATLAHATLPKHPIDGVNIFPVLNGTPNASPRDLFLFYYGNGGKELQAITDGHYKFVFTHNYRSYDGVKPGMDGQSGPLRAAKAYSALYCLDSDIAEKHDLQKRHPDIAEKLKQQASASRPKLGDSLRKIQGSEVRPPAHTLHD